MSVNEQTPTKSSFSKVSTSTTASFTKVTDSENTDFKVNVQTPTGDNLGGGGYGDDDLYSGDPYAGGMYERGSSHFKNRTVITVTH